MPRQKKNDMVTPLEEPFPLLRLPPEIRNSIWYLVVVIDGPIIIRKRHSLAESTSPSLNRSGKRRKQEVGQQYAASKLSVAFTCRQIYLEVTPIYYSKNSFASDPSHQYPQTLNEFLGEIGPEKANSIASVSMQGSEDPLIVNLSLFPNLQRTSIDGPTWYWLWRRFALRSSTLYPSQIAVENGQSLHSKPLVAISFSAWIKLAVYFEYLASHPDLEVKIRGAHLSSEALEDMRPNG